MKYLVNFAKEWVRAALCIAIPSAFTVLLYEMGIDISKHVIGVSLATIPFWILGIIIFY